MSGRPLLGVRNGLIALAGYAALLLWVYTPVWWGGPRGQRYFGWDCLREYYPDVVFGMHALRDGELPLWNPYSLGGYAFFGDSQAGMLAPMNWLLWCLAALVGSEGPWLIQAKVLLNLGVGLVGMHLLVHRLARSHVAGFVAAIVYVFGSPLLVHKNGAFLWPFLYLPWAVLALEHYLDHPSLRRGILLGGAVWLCGSAGHPQGFFYGLVILLPYWLFRTVVPVEDCWASVKRQWRGGLAAVVSMALLLLPLYLPALGAVARSPRAHRTLDYVLAQPLPPAALAELWAPYQDGNWMLDIYVGGLTLVLALFGVLAARRLAEGSRRLYWLALALLGVALAMGRYTPVLPWFAAHVPGFDMFRIAYRHKLIFGFAIALLAGLGAGALARGGLAPGRRWVVAGLGLLWGGLLLGMHLGWWWKVAPGKPAAAVAETLKLGLPALALTLAAAFHARRARWWMAGAAVLLLLDLQHAGALKRDILQPPPDPRRDQLVLKRLNGNPRHHRYFNDRVLPHYTPYLNEVRELSGFSNPIELKRHERLLKRMRRSPTLMARFNVRWWLTRRRPPRNRGITRLSPVVLELPDPAPLVQVFPAVEEVRSKEMIRRLARRGPLGAALVDPLDPEVAARPPTGLPRGEGEPVAGRVVAYHRNRIVVEVDSPYPGVAVINEAWYPGWRAYVNGVQTPIFRANYLLRGVRVERGRSRIELVFSPRWWYPLLAGFLLALLALILALSGRIAMLDRWPRPPSEPPESAPTPESPEPPDERSRPPPPPPGSQ